MEKWTSKNGKWTIEFEEVKGSTWIIASDGYVNYNGSIGYDSQVYWDKYPPKYIKKQAAVMARRHLGLKRIPLGVLE